MIPTQINETVKKQTKRPIMLPIFQQFYYQLVFPFWCKYEEQEKDKQQVQCEENFW